MSGQRLLGTTYPGVQSAYPNGRDIPIQAARTIKLDCRTAQIIAGDGDRIGLFRPDAVGEIRSSRAAVFVTLKSAVRRRRLVIGKSAQHGRLHEFEVRNLDSQLLEAALTVGNLGREKILVVIVERFTLKIFVGSVANGHGRARQY